MCFIQNENMKKLFTLIITALLLTQATHAQRGEGTLKVIDTFHIKSNGGWDYVTCENDLLYISHGGQVNILNAKNGDSVGIIAGTTGVHGITFSPKYHKGFTSNGKLNTCTIFNIETRKTIAEVKTGENPDALVYDHFSRHVFIGNGKSKDITVLDAKSNAVIATIPIGGKPEAIVTNAAGKIFVNVEDKNEIVVIDATTNAITNHWSIAPGDEPAGLAIDVQHNKLFAGCGNKLLIEVDAISGKIIKQFTIGAGCDGVAIDETLSYVYAANGQDATVTILGANTKGEYELLGNVPSKKGARTLCVNQNNHRIYLPTANFETPTEVGKRGKMLPNSFQIIVMGEQ